MAIIKGSLNTFYWNQNLLFVKSSWHKMKIFQSKSQFSWETFQGKITKILWQPKLNQNWTEKNWVQKTLRLKKILIPKNVKSKNVLVPKKYFGPKKIFDLKKETKSTPWLFDLWREKIWDKKIFNSKKFSVPKKILVPKNLLSPKKF